jgi:hypothetical protein
MQAMNDCRWYQHRRQRRFVKLNAAGCSTTAVGMQLLLLVLAAAGAGGGGGGHGHMTGHGLRPNCTTVCGGVSVPYPFGIEAGCYLHESFKLTCNTTGGYRTPRLVLWLGTDIYFITGISLDPSTMRFRPRKVIMEPGTGRGLSRNWTETQPPPGSGCHLFSEQARLDWEVGSNALVLEGRRRRRRRRAGSKTCPRDLGSTACHSSHSTCRPTTGPYRRFNHTTTGYVCNCHHGYQGNPYLPRGCQGNFNIFPA